jgi:hypothetical protein
MKKNSRGAVSRRSRRGQARLLTRTPPTYKPLGLFKDCLKVVVMVVVVVVVVVCLVLYRQTADLFSPPPYLAYEQ